MLNELLLKMQDLKFGNPALKNKDIFQKYDVLR